MRTPGAARLCATIALVGACATAPPVPVPHPSSPPPDAGADAGPDPRAVEHAAALAFDYPETPRASQSDVLHGVAVADPYRWLEGDGDEVERWLVAQDARARRALARLDSKPMIERMRALYAHPLPRLPVRRQRLAFSEDAKSLKVAEGDGPARVVLDKTALPGGTHVSGTAASPDGAHLLAAREATGYRHAR